MRQQLLSIFILINVILPVKATSYSPVQQSNHVTALMNIIQPEHSCPVHPFMPLSNIRTMMLEQAPTLKKDVLNKALTVLTCVQGAHLYQNNIFSIIDYSRPASEKRLWVFDLEKGQLLFHTYVSHGIKSGTLSTQYFSNLFDSKSSSIGLYRTDQAYYGREGLSLKLNGLEPGFNDNASNRAIVMHGGWYVAQQFIKKYGRPGRSWGCPALPLDMAKPVINTIKNNSLLMVYYPSDRWFTKSKFLTCENFSRISHVVTRETDARLLMDKSKKRDDILFADIKKINTYDETRPVLVMPASAYQHFLHLSVPIGRVLRRQIESQEYVALNPQEVEAISEKPMSEDNTMLLKTIHFVIPSIIMVRGYYETQMQLVNLGTIKAITPTTVFFNNKPPIHLRATSQFIRWIGL